MKRSTALKHIESILRLNLVINTDEVAEAVLNELECVGMRPPTREYATKNELFGSVSVQSQTWEPESDSN